MPKVLGTRGEDFIHQAGDGLNPPPGYGDIIGTTELKDLVRAGGGDDVVHAGGGEDTVRGADGNDILYGDLGNDFVYAESGDDIAHGGSGDDLLYGGDGQDILHGAGDDDAVFAGDGQDILYGGGGNDWMLGENGRDELFGGDGNDRLYSSSYFFPAGDTVDGEVLSGGEGDDSLSGSGGTDILDGGNGTDEVWYYTLRGAGVRVNLSAGTASGGDGGGRDTLISVENVIVLWDGFIPGEGPAGGGNDTLIGNEGANWLGGGGGSDRLFGKGGNDTLDLTSTGDWLHGGDGQDWLSCYFPDNEGDYFTTVVNLAAGTARAAALSQDRLASIENVSANLGDDTVIGSGAANQIDGLSSDDRLTGRYGNDTLIGGGGADALSGGRGADELWGDDPRWGGISADRFLYREVTASGVGTGSRDIIRDFDPSDGDVIVLKRMDADVGAAGDQAFTFIGAAAFGGAAGELRYAGGVVAGDVDGDGAADFEIELSGAPTLTRGDFAL